MHASGSKGARDSESVSALDIHSETLASGAIVRDKEKWREFEHEHSLL